VIALLMFLFFLLSDPFGWSTSKEGEEEMANLPCSMDTFDWDIGPEARKQILKALRRPGDDFEKLFGSDEKKL